MPQYLSPGVYVEEVEAGSRPIEGVGNRGRRVRRPRPARARQHAACWSRTGRQFVATFGDFMEGSYLAHSVYGYFLNGGGAAYVVRIGADGTAAPTARLELPSTTDR